MKKSPDVILLHYANQFIANSSYSQSKFIHDLLLPALIDAGLEKPEEHKTADEYETWRSAKVRHINGILNGHTNVPLRWLWCWLEVLPEPYGPDARKELLSQANLLDISLAGLNGKVTNRADLPKLFREVADVMEAGAAVAADGRYDQHDSPEQLRTLSDELTDVIELCLVELFAINQAVDLSGTRGGVIVEMCKSTK
ncbi:hypothetical protein ABCL21_004487 [Vibrio parahaemolyticus]|nr:hypothetical protein [Vibrio parahaemolyticus]HAV1337913.1 hypothetical protein [Vibrio parahaemolyticus]HAV1421238.1 hypothetical protein [Vibrio parahaemolyticus]HAV1545430.1 hypothetical protein [Vibrio parahaemolyticus]HAV1564991.1 hypothetical protein [Vibrio parahaemolyticus]